MASKIKVDQLETVDGTGNITVNQPLSGSGAGLTSLPAANLTGSLPAISGASLTGIPAANITGVIPTANLGTGTASSSTFLNGSGAYSEAGGGAWTLINSSTPSSVSSVTITGLDSSTYDTHVIVVSNLFPSNYNVKLMMKVGTSSGIITSSTYYYHLSESSDGGGTSYLGVRGEGTATPYVCMNVGEVASKGGCGATIYLTTNDGVRYPRWYGTYVAGSNNGNGGGGQLMGSQHGATNVDRLEFSFNAGTIVSGRVSVYGIAHA